jgi:hypothetical protein
LFGELKVGMREEGFALNFRIESQIGVRGITIATDYLN